MLAQAEDPDPVRDLKPPKNRELFPRFRMISNKKTSCSSDGKADDEFQPSSDDEVNFLLTMQLSTSNVDWVQYRIEKDTTLNSQVEDQILERP